MSNKIYNNHTIDEYNRKYSKNKKLCKISKDNATKYNYLLEKRKWWLINDTYYEIPTKHLKKPLIILSLVLLVGGGAGAATYYFMTRDNNTYVNKITCDTTKRINTDTSISFNDLNIKFNPSVPTDRSVEIEEVKSINDNESIIEIDNSKQTIKGLKAGQTKINVIAKGIKKGASECKQECTINVVEVANIAWRTEVDFGEDLGKKSPYEVAKLSTQIIFGNNVNYKEKIKNLNKVHIGEVSEDEVYAYYDSTSENEIVYFLSDRLINFENNDTIGSSSSIFEDCTKVTKILLDQTCFDQVTTGGNMFYNCASLTTIDGAKYCLNTKNFTDMGYMFYNCHALKNLYIDYFDTSNVRNMQAMFNFCSNLATIEGINKFNTANVTNMTQMFQGCKALTSLDVSTFNTKCVKTMDRMFDDCEELTSITGLDKFDTTNVTDMSSMFRNNYKLTSLNLTNFDTSNVTNMSQMIMGSTLETIDISSFVTTNLKNTEKMFHGCKQLITIVASKSFDNTNIEKSDNMFNSCSNLKVNDVSVYDENTIDKTYARIWTTEEVGYFTAKE